MMNKLVKQVSPVILWDILYYGMVDDSQAILMMNIATVYCIRQEMEKARKALQQACTSIHRNGPTHAKAVLLSAYIELHTGMLLLIVQYYLI